MSGDDEDHHDHPSSGNLIAIATWSGDLFKGGLHEWFALAYDEWWARDWGWKRAGDDYEIATGGWSGNEAIIDAMMENAIAWSLTWQQSRRGGHCLFSVPSAARSPIAPPAASP